MLAPYTQMAQSAILAIGVKLDTVPAQNVAFLQAGLIRLGFDPGRIDGVHGNRTTKALEAAGADLGDPITWLSDALRAKFPAEYAFRSRLGGGGLNLARLFGALCLKQKS